MHSDGPCPTDWKLGISAQQVFFYLLLFVIECVSHILPHFALYVQFISAVCDYADDAFFLINLCDAPQSAIHPSLVFVVLDEDDLCAYFEFQFYRGWEGTDGEVALNPSGEGARLTLYAVQFLLIDV